MRKALLLLSLISLQGCFLMPYNVSSNYRHEQESQEKRNTALNAVYAPPRLSITVDGDSHTINIPEGILDNVEPNSINIGENTELETESKESASFSKKFDWMGMAFAVIVTLAILAGVKKVAAIVLPQIQTLMHLYSKD